jgi:hypothetical protein
MTTNAFNSLVCSFYSTFLDDVVAYYQALTFLEIPNNPEIGLEVSVNE